jgi:hypothetical protein
LNPYVLSIAIPIAAASIVSAVIQYRFQVSAVAAYPSRNELVAFFGYFYAWTGAASLASQLFLSTFLLSRFGVIAGLFVLPASFTVGSIFTLLSPSLWTAGFGRFADLTFKFTVNNASLEMLWLPVPPEERQSVKPFVSGTVKAVAEASTALLLFGLVKFTPAWVPSVFALSICGIWIMTVLRLRAQYRDALVSVIEKRQLDAEALHLSATDPVVVESLNRGLRSAEEAEQLAALSFLDGLPLQPWADVLRDLLANGSPEIRERVFLLAAKDRDILTDETVLATARSGGALASVALDVAAERGVPQLDGLLRDLLNSGDSRTSIAAAATILRNDAGDPESARTVARGWLRAHDTVAITEVLRLLPSDEAVLTRVDVASLLRHANPAVRCAAIEAAAARRDVTLLPDIIATLADPRCARPARLALREMPPDLVVRGLTAVLDRGSDERVRRAALRLLREYAGTVTEDQVAAQIEPIDLNTYLEFADLLRAVRNVRPVQPQVSRRVLQDCSSIRTEAYFCDGLQARLENDPDAVLLRDHAVRRFSLAVGTTLRLTALQYPGFAVDACLHAANSGDRAMLPYVLELIESTLNGPDKRLLAPLVDVSQVERRRSILRELVTNPELQAEERIQRAVSSPDPWEAGVAFHYLVRKGKVARSATANGHVTAPQEHAMYSTLEKTIVLKSSELFGGLPAENLATLAAVATEIRCPVGAFLFREGDAGDSLYVLTSGRVRIVKGGSEIAALVKGACFGEMAVLDGAPRSADAVVVDEAVVLRIGSEEFYDVLAENPALTQGIVGLLTRRLREANARIARAEC